VGNIEDQGKGGGIFVSRCSGIIPNNSIGYECELDKKIKGNVAEDRVGCLLQM
jgi:hypothetical protein